MTARGGPLAVLATLGFGRFCMGLQMQALAAIGPFLMADLAFTYSDIGLLIGLFLAPGVLLGMPGAMLGARFGYRRIGLIGVVLMAVGALILALMQDFASAAAGRLVAGTGGILVNITFLRMVTETFAGRAMNRAIAVVMSSWPVGMALSAVAFPYLAASADWRLPLFALSALSALAAICAYFYLPAPLGSTAARGPLLSFSLDRRSWQLSLLAGGGFAMFTAGGVIFLSFGPVFLTERGYTLTDASGIASLIVWLGLVGTPLGGWLADRLGSSRMVILAGSLGSALLVALVVVGGPPLLLSLVAGIVWGLPAAPFTGLLQRTLPQQSLGAGYGIYFTLFYAGFFGFPAVAGWLMDLSRTTSTALWFAAGLLALTFALLVCFFSIAGRGKPGA
jgi:predicted MFS family arabinose efflux permease